MIFLFLIASIVKSTNKSTRARALGKSGDYSIRLAASLRVFLGMNIMFSLFAYGLSGYEWYFMAGLSEVLDRMTTGQAQSRGCISRGLRNSPGVRNATGEGVRDSGCEVS